MMPKNSGLILLNKRPGMTSFESLAVLKRAFATGKAGHTGTLDKFAEGLLLVLTARALKLAPWFSGCGKEYEGTIRFGAETDTLDPEGAVVEEADPPGLAALEAALPAFRGDLLQAPPAYSAVHIDGKRAHALARSGQAPVMKKRPVSVYELELLSFDGKEASIRVRCSAGTYIRSLARDLARAAGSRGHLVSLRRTKVAGFSLSDAVSADAGEGALRTSLRPVDRGVFEKLGIPVLSVDRETGRRMCHGQDLDLLLKDLETPDAPALAVFRAGLFVGIIEKTEKEGRWSYGHIYARSGEFDAGD